MDFKTPIIEELRVYRDEYKNVNVQELTEGHALALKVEPFDNPEDYLNERELFLLGQYYEYNSIVESKTELKPEDRYVFDDEDLDDDLD